jgi:hypothetical protein
MAAGVVELTQEPAPVLFVIGSMVAMCVFLLFLAWCNHWADRRFPQFIQHRSREVEQILCQFHRGLVAAKAEQQHQIAVRALRFHMLMSEAMETTPWDQVTLRLLTEQLSCFRDPVDAAELIQLATGMGTQFCDALIVECRKLGSERLASIYREAVNRPNRTTNLWQLFRMYAATSDLTCEPDLLPEIIVYPKWGSGAGKEESERVDRLKVAAVVRLLRACPLATLVAALLMGLRLGQATDDSGLKRAGDSLIAKVKLLRRYCEPLLMPICRLEALLWAPALAVCAVLLFSGLSLALIWTVVFVVPVLFHVALFARTHD